MDTLQFQPGWQDSDREWMLGELKNFLTKSMKLGLSMATTLGVAMKKECWKLTKLSFSTFHHGLVSFEPLNGISHIDARSEKVWLQVALNAFDWEFIRWILWDGRTKNAKERYQRVQETYLEKVIVLQSQKEIDHFLDNLVHNKKTNVPNVGFFAYPITLPFGTAGSTVRRVNCPSCSAERIIPWLTYFFIILRGLRLATIWTFLPTNSCSFG